MFKRRAGVILLTLASAAVLQWEIAGAAPVRCSNHDHHDTGSENHRLSDPRVHDRSAAGARWASSAPAAAGVRLAPHLDVDEAVCAAHEVPKRVETNAGQPHEHTRVVHIVCFQVVDGRVVFDKRVTVGEGHHHDQGVRFGRLMGRHAYEHPPVHLQSRLAPCGCHLHARKGAADSLDCCERVPAMFMAVLFAR